MIDIVGGAIESTPADVGRSRTAIDDDTFGRLDPERIEVLAPLIPSAVPGMVNGSLSTGLIIRGFPTGTPRWNGLPDIDRLFVRDPATIATIDVLSGVDAVGMGLGSPGGVIRFTGKRPLAEPATEIGVSVGHPERARLTFDQGGPLAEHWSYRLVAAGQTGETQPDDRRLDRWHGLVGLQWDYRADSHLLLEYEQQHNQREYRFGTILQGDRIRYDHEYASPEQDSDRRYRRLGLEWQHRLTPDTRLTLAHAHSRVRRDETLIGFWSQLDGNRLSGYYSQYHDRYRQDDTRLRLDHHIRQGRLTQHWTAGIDHNRHRVDFGGEQALWNYRANDWAFTLDADDPGFDRLDLAALPVTPRSVREEARQRGYWLTQQLQWERRWQLAWGVRHNRYEITGARNGVDRRARNEGQTWQLALRLPLGEHGHLRLATGRGMEPVFGETRDGSPLPPAHSRLGEIGIGWRLPHAQRLELVGYRLQDARPVSLDDPRNPAAVRLDKRESEGIEARYQWRHRNWQIEINAGWLRSRNADADGRAFVGVPARTASLWLQHDLRPRHQLPLQLWWQWHHVGPRYADTANTRRIDGHQRHAIGLRWQHGKARLDLGIHNLLDTRHIAAITGPSGIYPGPPRQIRAGWTYRF